MSQTEIVIFLTVVVIFLMKIIKHKIRYEF
jgi:hypothetical protein